MRAVVLVGGEGTRLRPLTLTTPKQMLPVAGLTMIERVLGHLAAHGVQDAVLSMGYRPDAFVDAFPDGRAAGVALTYAVEPEPLDTAGAIRFAAAAAGIDEPFLVLNGDVLTDLDIDALVSQHRERAAEATIHLVPVEDPSRFGVVPTDASGRVLGFVEKPAPGSAPTNLINAGTYVMEPSVLARIAGGRPVSVEREVFPAMVADGSLFALATDDYWVDAGTHEKYLQCQLDLLGGRRPGPPHPAASEVEPGVWTIGPACGPSQTAPGPAAPRSGNLRPPVLLGRGASVAPGGQVERSVLGDDVCVSEGAQVRRSVLLAGAQIGAGAVIEDSILGHGVVVAEGAKLTGLSVVGDGAHIGPGARLDGGSVDPRGRLDQG